MHLISELAIEYQQHKRKTETQDLVSNSELRRVGYKVQTTPQRCHLSFGKQIKMMQCAYGQATFTWHFSRHTKEVYQTQIRIDSNSHHQLTEKLESGNSKESNCHFVVKRLQASHSNGSRSEGLVMHAISGRADTVNSLNYFCHTEKRIRLLTRQESSQRYP